MTRPARRQYGEGSITAYETKGGTRFRCQWYERDSATGQTHRRQKAGFRTKREAATYLRERAVDASRGGVVALQTPTLGEYLQSWLAGHRAAPSTLAGYRRLSRLHIEPYLGATRLNELTAGHLARLYRKLERTPGPHSDRPLGANSIRKAHQLLSVVLSAAVEDRYILLNPASLKAAKPPTSREVLDEKPQIQIWQPGSLLAFYEWARSRDPELFITWRLIGETGVRRGEALGLTWGDIDLDRRLMTIRHALVTVKNLGARTEHILQPPKSAKPRTISIDGELASELRIERERQVKEGLPAGPECPILVMWSGRQLIPESLSRRWREAVERFTAETDTVPAIPLHGLRHTHATHLLAAGVSPKVVQQRLGHANFQITMDTYAHVLEHGDEQALGQLKEFRKASGLDSEYT